MKTPYFLLKDGIVKKAIYTFQGVTATPSGNVLTQDKISVPSNGGLIIEKIAASQDSAELDILNDAENTLGGTYGLPFKLPAFPANLEPVDVGIWVSSEKTRSVMLKLTSLTGTDVTVTAIRVEVIQVFQPEKAGMVDVEL